MTLEARCAVYSKSALPPTPETEAAFPRDQATSKTTATVQRRAAAIACLHRAAGLPNPCADELLRLALKGIARLAGTERQQAAGLTECDLGTIRARLGSRLKDVRDLALLLVGRDLLARARDLVGL